MLQPGRVAQRFGGSESTDIDPIAIGLARSGGRPLPQALLTKMEAAFGADFSAVRVHVGPQASRIGAIAFTTGNDLYFAPGQFQPDSVKGQQLIGHELAHVIQQRQGRVRAVGSGVSVVQDAALEAEADRLGMQAAAFRTSVQRKAWPHRAAQGTSAPILAAGLGGARLPLNIVQAMDWSSDEEEEDDVDFGDDAEFIFDPKDDVLDPEEFIGISKDPRPSAYSGLFGQIYTSNAYAYFSTNTSNGVKTYKCAKMACDNKHHGKNCDGFVYVVKGSQLSPTTPVSKKRNGKYVSKCEKPPMCHIVDWVILKEALAAACGSNPPSGTLLKFICWGNLDNLTTGRRTCNIKSNKGQEKYDTLTSGKKLKVDNYIIKMIGIFNTQGNVVGKYGSIL